MFFLLFLLLFAHQTFLFCLTWIKLSFTSSTFSSFAVLQFHIFILSFKRCSKKTCQYNVYLEIHIFIIWCPCFVMERFFIHFLYLYIVHWHFVISSLNILLLFQDTWSLKRYIYDKYVQKHQYMALRHFWKCISEFN